MEDELQKDEIIPAETVTESTGMQPDSPEGSGEISTTETNPNDKAIEYINRFAQGSPTSTPEEIIAGLIKCLDVTSVPYDQFADVAYSSQESAAFMYDLKETGDPLKALARNYDPEEIQAAVEAISTDDDFEEARTSHQSKVEGKKAYMAHQEENMKLTQTGAEEFMEEMSISEEEEAAFIAFTDEFLMDAADNKLTKVRWMQLWKAFRHDSAVAEAEENGKIMGKNEKISTGKKTREDLKHEMPEGGSAADTEPVKKQTYAESLNTSSPLKKLKLQ